MVLGVATALFAARTLARNTDWQNALTLATSAVRVSPNSFKGHTMIAEALFAADGSHANIDRAIEEADRSVAILDPVPDVRNHAPTFRLAAGFYLLRGDRQFRHDLGGDTQPPPSALADYRKALPLALRYASIIVKSGAGGTLADARELLAGVYLRAGDTESALRSAQEAGSLDPFRPGTYRLKSDALLGSGRAEDAAVTLYEGILVTSDPALRRRLLDLYSYSHVLNSGGCALLAGPNGPAINPRCSTVRQQICRAAPGALRTLANAGREDAKRALAATLVQDSGCNVR